MRTHWNILISANYRGICLSQLHKPEMEGSHCRKKARKRVLESMRLVYYILFSRVSLMFFFLSNSYIYYKCVMLATVNNDHHMHKWAQAHKSIQLDDGRVCNFGRLFNNRTDIWRLVCFFSTFFLNVERFFFVKSNKLIIILQLFVIANLFLYWGR